MPRTAALDRQWNLLRVLSQHLDGLSIDEMAARTGVNARTIRRDLSLFLDAGIPLRETVGRRNKKTWRVDSAKTPFLERYTPDEYLALLLTERVLEPLRQTDYFNALSRGLSRAAQNLDKSARIRIERLVAGLSLRNDSCVQELGGHLAKLFAEAMSRNRSLDYAANSDASPSVRTSHEGL